MWLGEYLAKKVSLSGDVDSEANPGSANPIIPKEANPGSANPGSANPINSEENPANPINSETQEGADTEFLPTSEKSILPSPEVLVSEENCEVNLKCGEPHSFSGIDESRSSQSPVHIQEKEVNRETLNPMSCSSYAIFLSYFHKSPKVMNDPLPIIVEAGESQEPTSTNVPYGVMPCMEPRLIWPFEADSTTVTRTVPESTVYNSSESINMRESPVYNSSSQDCTTNDSINMRESPVWGYNRMVPGTVFGSACNISSKDTSKSAATSNSQDFEYPRNSGVLNADPALRINTAMPEGLQKLEKHASSKTATPKSGLSDADKLSESERSDTSTPYSNLARNRTIPPIEPESSVFLQENSTAMFRLSRESPRSSWDCQALILNNGDLQSSSGIEEASDDQSFKSAGPAFGLRHSEVQENNCMDDKNPGSGIYVDDALTQFVTDKSVHKVTNPFQIRGSRCRRVFILVGKKIPVCAQTGKKIWKRRFSEPALPSPNRIFSKETILLDPENASLRRKIRENYPNAKILNEEDFVEDRHWRLHLQRQNFSCLGRKPCRFSPTKLGRNVVFRQHYRNVNFVQMSGEFPALFSSWNTFTENWIVVELDQKRGPPLTLDMVDNMMYVETVQDNEPQLSELCWPLRITASSLDEDKPLLPGKSLLPKYLDGVLNEVTGIKKSRPQSRISRENHRERCKFARLCLRIILWLQVLLVFGICGTWMLRALQVSSTTENYCSAVELKDFFRKYFKVEESYWFRRELAQLDHVASCWLEAIDRDEHRAYKAYSTNEDLDTSADTKDVQWSTESGLVLGLQGNCFPDDYRVEEESSKENLLRRWQHQNKEQVLDINFQESRRYLGELGFSVSGLVECDKHDGSSSRYRRKLLLFEDVTREVLENASKILDGRDTSEPLRIRDKTVSVARSPWFVADMWRLLFDFCFCLSGEKSSERCLEIIACFQVLRNDDLVRWCTELQDRNPNFRLNEYVIFWWLNNAITYVFMKKRIPFAVTDTMLVDFSDDMDEFKKKLELSVSCNISVERDGHFMMERDGFHDVAKPEHIFDGYENLLFCKYVEETSERNDQFEKDNVASDAPKVPSRNIPDLPHGVDTWLEMVCPDERECWQEAEPNIKMSSWTMFWFFVVLRNDKGIVDAASAFREPSPTED